MLILKALQRLTYLILLTTLWGMYYYYLHLTDLETEGEKLNNLLKFI